MPPQPGTGVPVEATERVLTLLAAGGALDDFPASTFRALPAPLRARLAAELATTSLAHRDGDGGARALARRRAAVVRIEGDRRIGRTVARILASSGIGQVQFARALAESGRRSARRAQAAARPRQAAGQAGRTEQGGPARGAEPGGSARRAEPAQVRQAFVNQPDLVILVGRQPGELTMQLARDRVPHLAVMAGEAIGIVGPLVVPGQTACLRCLDYVRAGNDPAWPLILAQIGRRRPEPPACDAVLAATVAAQAAAQAMTAIEQAPIASPAANGTLELVLPDWRWRRRTWPRHPACPCAAHTAR